MTVTGNTTDPDSRPDSRPDNGSVDWLLDQYVNHVPDARHALAVSVDGLLVASSNGLHRDDGDRLAATVSGMVSLHTAACQQVDAGAVIHAMLTMTGGVMLLLSLPQTGSIAVVTHPNPDLGQVAHEATLLAQRVGRHLAPGSR
ncbi:MAG: uncharacterized protein QOI74_1766 [Micromonosporaceae bacterium]|nr:uncharacterized protein [Micromonosporaceae bacterium]MDT5036985.1 uncharacterized protein [Micromonosporaceae bacterium]